MKKLNYDYVKEQIEKEGYKLLSKTYINAHTKLKVKCDKGHIYKVAYYSFQQGRKCPICNGKVKLTYDYIKEQFEKEGYNLLSNKYVNSKTKLKIQCDKGHIYKTIWSVFQQGHKCPICNGNKKFTYEYVKEQIEKEGYKLLSKNYKNNYTKLKVQCDKGHKYKVIWDSFQKGRRCPYCYGNAKNNYEYIKEQIESVNGYKLLSKEYKNNYTKLKVQCDKGHIYEVTYANFTLGSRCPICDAGKTSSKAENEIFNIIEELLPNENIIANDRTQIINPLTEHNLELDIWIPSLNKAIEFNGVYWHSLEEVKVRDAEKVKQCKEKGIDLLVIQEQNWVDNKSKVIEQIENVLMREKY